MSEPGTLGRVREVLASIDTDEWRVISEGSRALSKELARAPRLRTPPLRVSRAVGGASGQIREMIMQHLGRTEQGAIMMAHAPIAIVMGVWLIGRRPTWGEPDHWIDPLIAALPEPTRDYSDAPADDLKDVVSQLASTINGLDQAWDQLRR